MPLTSEQQKKVTDNIGLVRKVLADKVFGMERYGIYSYEDLFQIGCIGLCKAAATDKGGTFSTYAYCLIWHEICDALIYANKRRETEIPFEYTESMIKKSTNMESVEEKTDIIKILTMAKEGAAPIICKGIDALILMNRGYTYGEIGKNMGVSPNLVRAWASKARRYLCKIPEFQ